MSAGNGHHDHPRDVAFERAFTYAAAALAGRNAAALIELAEQRTPLEPILNIFLRNLPNDGLEEGADWRNYCCFQGQLLDLLRAGGDPRAPAARAAVQRCLAAIIVAFDEQRVAHDLIAQLLADRALHA